jgi:hypothetical protein
MPVIPILRMVGTHRLEPERERFEQLRRRERAPDVVTRLEDRDRLIDDVIFVGLEVFAPSFFDQLDHPARIEIDTERDASAMLCQMLDGQPQAARAGRPEHQPVGALRKVFIGQRRAEDLVVGAEVVAVDARLRGPRRAPGLEHEDRLARESTRHPPLDRPAPEPFVFEEIELLNIVESIDAIARVPPEFLRVVEPEGTSRRRVEVPCHNFADPRVERLASGLSLCRYDRNR